MREVVQRQTLTAADVIRVPVRGRVGLWRSLPPVCSRISLALENRECTLKYHEILSHSNTGTGLLVQSPFQQGAKVTCKTHLGPIPKNFVATVTGKDIKVIQNDDGEDFAMEFPRLRCYHSSRNYYITVQTKDELKRIVSAPSSAPTYNAGWPVGLGNSRIPQRSNSRFRKIWFFRAALLSRKIGLHNLAEICTS